MSLSTPPSHAQSREPSGLALFLPCAAQTEALLGDEVRAILTAPEMHIAVQRGGVRVYLNEDAVMDAVMRLNLHSRMAQRVLIALTHNYYRSEDDVYELASGIAWEQWFAVNKTIKVDVTAHNSPLKSLNFVALRLKDAVADRFRHLNGTRPSVDTHRPDVRIHLHLDAEQAFISLDTSGEPLFKRGWREDKGDAPLKETLAATMIAASGWDPLGNLPLYDPCCGSGTIVVEAAQMACGIAPGLQRRFAFENFLSFQRAAWQALCTQAKALQRKPTAEVFGSDISHRMVDFSKRNAERAGVAHVVQLRGGDALQRMPPSSVAGTMLLNPPYGTRIAAAGEAGRNMQQRRDMGFSAREFSDGDDGGAFFQQLSAHWKGHYAGWTAWLLTPDMKLPGKLRLKETRRVPMWNGPIDCRLFRFDLTARRVQPDVAS